MPENVCILAGIDPEGNGDWRENAFPFLPGALAFYGFPDGCPSEPAGLDALGKVVREHVDYLLGMLLPTSHPHVAIKAVTDANLPIPWLEAARADTVCRRLLPARLKAVAGGTLEGPQAKGGRERARRSWPDRRMQVDRAFELYKAGKGLKAIQDDLAVRFNAPLHPGRWIARFRKGETPADIVKD